MDDIITMTNVIFRFAMAAFFAWAVLSHRVFDGIVIKLGLIIMSMGFFGSAAIMAAGDTWRTFPSMMRAELMIHGGLFVVLMGVYWRFFCGPPQKRKQRRKPLTDYNLFADCPDDNGRAK